MISLKKLSTITLLGCLAILPNQLAAQEQAKQASAPKADIYIVPEAKDLPLSLDYPAQIYAAKSVNVVARVPGVLKEKFFEEGSFVEKGQKLYEIEDDIYRAKVEAREASLQRAKANLNNATRNWDRVKKLYAKKVVSQEKRDQALSDYEQAVASLAVSKAELKQAKIDFEYTNVLAPISGVAGMQKVDVGDYVSAGTQALLLEITQNKKVHVEFSMPLSDYENIKNKAWTIPKDKQIEIELLLENKQIEKKGFIDFIDVSANKDTSTLKMRAVIDNEDGYLVPGSFARVLTKDIYQKDVITIPQKALLQNPLGTIVFVEKDGVVQTKPVKVGNETKDLFVLKGGALKSGDRVIVNNFFRLKPGSKVTVDKTINK